MHARANHMVGSGSSHGQPPLEVAKVSDDPPR